MKNKYLLLTTIFLTTALTSCSNDLNFINDGEKIVLGYHDKYITKSDCLADWKVESLCKYNSGEHDFIEFTEYAKYKKYVDMSKEENFSLEGFYGPFYKNERTYNSVTPSSNISFAKISINEKPNKTFDYYETDYAVGRKHNGTIKEIQDVYSKLDSCISDWQNKDLCIRDSDNITNKNNYFSLPYNETTGRKLKDKNDIENIPLTNTSISNIITRENGEMYIANYNPLEVRKINKRRDVYRNLNYCLKDWEYEELCTKIESNYSHYKNGMGNSGGSASQKLYFKYNIEYMGPIYEKSRMFRMSDKIIEPKKFNAENWFLLLNNGQSYLSSNPNKIVLNMEEIAINAMPFKNEVTSTGINANPNNSFVSFFKIKTLNGLAKRNAIVQHLTR